MFVRIFTCLLLSLLPAVSQGLNLESFKKTKTELEEEYYQVAKQFAEAKTAEEAFAFVRSEDKESFDKAFERYHQKSIGEIHEKVNVFSQNLNQYALLKNTTKSGELGYLMMIWTSEMKAPKVDWMASYGYGAMSWEQFQEVQPEIGIEMRAILQATNYYNFTFSDEKVWQSFLIYRKNKDSIYAYLKRDHPKFQEFVEELRGKKLSSFTLKLAYPEGDKQVDQVEIVDLINNTWFDIVE